MYKRIREGLTLEKAKEIISQKESIKEIFLMLKVFRYGRDIFGNATAHYECSLVLEFEGRLEFHPIVGSGRYRRQTGYGRIHSDAAYCLEKLGYEISENPIETTLSYDCFKILNI